MPDCSGLGNRPNYGIAHSNSVKATATGRMASTVRQVSVYNIFIHFYTMSGCMFMYVTGMKLVLLNKGSKVGGQFFELNSSNSNLSN